ncbi:MAG TPA: glucodextranase DOMON-like domain-containing protein [Anaerolineales bacterium]|nr:glucodextranase DOMON-like domain-containing protein [Anaerolineales bacterium]
MTTDHSRLAAKPLKIALLTSLLLLGLGACRQEVDEAPTHTAPPPTLAATVPAEPATPVDEGGSTPAAPAGEPIYLSIIWHQHQPVYYKDAETNSYIRPWVRVHATKDYVDMAAILREYPEIHATFNLTPSLIRQLDDLGAGAKDLYWTLSEIPADELTEEQKQFILDRFFDTNRNIIARFPRYQALLNLRDGSTDPRSEFTGRDYRDLQVLFNLAWVDPDWLEEEPLAGLVTRGRDYSESDKVILFEEHLRLINEVIPIHRELQENGQIEVTMTPYAHPILPLLYSTDLARNALPEIDLPAPAYTYGLDAVNQVALGVQLYEDHFGRPPLGMWPAEGSVAQEVVSMVAQNDIRWIASDEGVLANSLGFDSFSRSPNEVVVEAEQLYRPYSVEGTRGGPVAIVFRDVVLSDKVGFTYSGQDGEAAAQDFVDRIHAIRDQLIESGTEGPFLVSVILDGENAWEHYENDGKEFLHGLYRRLSEDAEIVTVTPSEFLSLSPDQPPIDDLWAGSWINHDFSTWIGEEEENLAWELLGSTRSFLEQYIHGNRKGQVEPDQLARALDQMYVAEGSDWFWWYGADQNSGNDEIFDLQFRNTLKEVYRALGQEPPVELDVPVIPQQAAEADQPASGLISPAIDGQAAEGEWDSAGQYLASGGVMAGGVTFLESILYGFDAENLYLRVDLDPAAISAESENIFEVYLSAPGGGDAASFSRMGSLLGFPANWLVELALSGSTPVDGGLYLVDSDQAWARQEGTGLAFEGASGLIEIAIPLSDLGSADTGDRLTFRSFFVGDLEFQGEAVTADLDTLPGSGPAIVAVPDLGTTTILLEIVDPEMDDHGPGTYTYPSDPVFSPGNFDITSFQVGVDDENVVFRFQMRGPVDNSWGSPNGLSLQTFDIYIDQDHDGAGGGAMLPGRNLVLQDAAWDYAVTIEGWDYGIYIPGSEGPQRVVESSEFEVLVDPGQQKVTVRIPKALLGGRPEDWSYAAVVLSQEGFPSGGVMRVRDVLPVAEQWRIGGAPQGATNHTRVIDLVWGTGGDQEIWLSDFQPVNLPQAELVETDFALIPLFSIE